MTDIITIADKLNAKANASTGLERCGAGGGCALGTRASPLMTDYRVVLCEACGSEGRLVDDYYGDKPCKWCDGTGGEVIKVQPIEQHDLALVEEAVT
jgi:DnaJ-class molecular chaperone